MQALTYIGIILAIISVVFGIFSIIFIIINIKAIRNQNDNAIRSERNERFKNAINQLGSENNAIALGGIYTLHRIAKEDESYRENVFNILCSYVRDITITDEYKTKYTEKPSEPIQTILNILCKNENDYKIYKEYIIDFSGANLSCANLMNANLIDTHLWNVNFKDADLRQSKLLNTNLSEANLTNAHLEMANLTEANLIDANLIDANLFFTTLTLANLKGANLTRADLQEADLKGAFISNANLTGTNLGNACLKGTTSIVRTILYKSFEYYIRLGINKQTDLSGISGGYDKNNPPYAGKPITGKYTEEEAKQMIENYYNNLK